MTSINPAIFRAYDIRGLSDGEITEELAYRIGRTFPRSGERVILGYDMRPTSPALAAATASGIMDAGAQCIDIGLVATPTFYYAVRAIDCAVGIQVTASHNPAAYNGFKLVRRAGSAVVKVGGGMGMEAVRDAVVQWTSLPSATPRGQRRSEAGIVAREIADACALVPLDGQLPSRVVVDAGNGMGALFLDALAHAMGMTMDRLYFDLDGTFPNHPADPLQTETLRDLQARIRATDAHLGIATDGDGDRIFFLDEHGAVVPASLTTAIIATELLRDHPGSRVLVDVRYQRNATAAVVRAGGSVSVSRVGHALISDQLRREDGVFAGESSGHYFFRSAGYAESTVLAILYVLRALMRTGRSLSELAASHRVAAESGEVNFALRDPATIATCLTAIRERYADSEQSELDGISVSYPDWRCNIRASNTGEPTLRLNVEGASAEIVEAKRRELEGNIRRCVE